MYVVARHQKHHGCQTNHDAEGTLFAKRIRRFEMLRGKPKPTMAAAVDQSPVLKYLRWLLRRQSRSRAWLNTSKIQDIDTTVSRYTEPGRVVNNHRIQRGQLHSSAHVMPKQALGFGQQEYTSFPQFYSTTGLWEASLTLWSERHLSHRRWTLFIGVEVVQRLLRTSRPPSSPASCDRQMFDSYSARDSEMLVTPFNQASKHINESLVESSVGYIHSP